MTWFAPLPISNFVWMCSSIILTWVFVIMCRSAFNLPCSNLFPLVFLPNSGLETHSSKQSAIRTMSEQNGAFNVIELGTITQVVTRVGEEFNQAKGYSCKHQLCSLRLVHLWSISGETANCPAPRVCFRIHQPKWSKASCLIRKTNQCVCLFLCAVPGLWSWHLKAQPGSSSLGVFSLKNVCNPSGQGA